MINKRHPRQKSIKSISQRDSSLPHGVSDFMFKSMLACSTCIGACTGGKRNYDVCPIKERIPSKVGSVVGAESGSSSGPLSRMFTPFTLTVSALC